MNKKKVNLMIATVFGGPAGSGKAVNHSLAAKPRPLDELNPDELASIMATLPFMQRVDSSEVTIPGTK